MFFTPEIPVNREFRCKFVQSPKGDRMDFLMNEMNANETNKNLQSITEIGGISTEGDGGSFYCLSIIGQIEGHYSLDSNQKTTKYDHLLPLLVGLEESERVDGILILLNTLIKHPLCIQRTQPGVCSALGVTL